MLVAVLKSGRGSPGNPPGLSKSALVDGPLSIPSQVRTAKTQCFDTLTHVHGVTDPRLGEITLP